ncbi:uncharacterized protein LOC131282447 [Anopheles ziemanni]|uniref:uncharacterized protein LOC131266587 n=1 Tax=Anopheles coustani TaxID=139045 RepID=UPI00265A0B9D|nr:uncharacterized protein LOC131266587 [Anopheles coustani]XP_058167903.1 uncharacterized protein LOC131282447 [Anopheles ziemanni]
MELIWDNISTTLELSSELSQKWLTKLRAQYSESHRHYHNEHELIGRKVPLLAGSNVCLQLAVLFQYYYFEADKDCMARNCEAVSEFFNEINLGNKTLEANVKRLLGDLQSEAGDLCEEDVKFFQDLDLLVLGTPPDEYKQYTQQLRLEYQSEDIGSYDKTRLKLLQTLCRIPCIYLTKNLSEYENLARENIVQEIKELQTK